MLIKRRPVTPQEQPPKPRDKLTRKNHGKRQFKRSLLGSKQTSKTSLWKQLLQRGLAIIESNYIAFMNQCIVKNKRTIS